MKLYTRTGDLGTTGLADGSRVDKHDIRIESYGCVDELNSVIAVCRHHCQDFTTLPVEAWLVSIQNDLFNIGSDLATPIQARWAHMVLIDATDVKALEQVIDRCQNELPALREFVLPGGSLANAYLHLARTVCRRAERVMVKLAASFPKTEEPALNPFLLPYINRLSDFLFVLARWTQQASQCPEVKWNKSNGIRNHIL